VYAPPELWPPAETAYRYGLGALQWPFRSLWSLIQNQTTAAFVPVRATADPSDLVALSMLWVAWRVAIADIEKKTDLDFGQDVRDADTIAQAGQPPVGEALRLVKSFDDIKL